MALDQSLLTAMHIPRIHQVGLVVWDMECTVKYLQNTLGIGPWYRAAPGPVHDVWYQGKKIDSQLDFVMAFAGGVQIELISSRGEPNIYTEHLEKFGEGLHHLCSFVSDFNATLNAYQKAGYKEIQRGHIVSKGGSVTDYAYFNLSQGGRQTLITEISSSKLSGKIFVRMTPFMMKVGALTGDLQRVQY